MSRYSISPYTGMSPSLMDDFFNQSLERFFGNAPSRSSGRASSFRTTLPAVNVAETDEAYEVHVAAPGMQKSDFDVNVEDNVLRISAETKYSTDEADDDSGYHRREFSYASFERRFSLPDNVDDEQITASYEDGILKLAIPKVDPEEQQPSKRQIEIA